MLVEKEHRSVEENIRDFIVENVVATKLSDHLKKRSDHIASQLRLSKQYNAPVTTPEKTIQVLIESSQKGLDDNGPLVTIICVVRNCEKYISRALTSMKSQTYKNIEIIIQDGLSTDRTAEIVKEAGFSDCFFQEKDTDTLDGFFKAVNKAKGDIIGVCWSDDELLPHAASWAAAMFAKNEEVDVLYGDQIIVDSITNSRFVNYGCAWDQESFIKCEFYPPFSSTFFRRDALLECHKRVKTFDHDEYEFWLWLSMSNIRYVPGLISVFHTHGDTRWKVPGYTISGNRAPGKIRALRDFLQVNPHLLAQASEEKWVSNVTLWAALHEISCANSIVYCLEHIKQIKHMYDDDRRYNLVLTRLVELSLQQDGHMLPDIIGLANEMLQRVKIDKFNIDLLSFPPQGRDIHIEIYDSKVRELSTINRWLRRINLLLRKCCFKAKVFCKELRAQITS